LILAAPAGAGALFLVKGAGWGNGVGMSQWGAEGYALHGWSYRRIVAHYYPHTTIATAPDEDVRVLIVEQKPHVSIGAAAPFLLELYLRGLVPWEMPGHWQAQAYEAQAVAARSFAVADHIPTSAFDLYADNRSQMYGGIAAETAATNAAVGDSTGQVLTYAG